MELDGHPFFVATLFQPEMRSLAEGATPSPIVAAFATACQRRHERLTKAAS